MLMIPCRLQLSWKKDLNYKVAKEYKSAHKVAHKIVKMCNKITNMGHSEAIVVNQIFSKPAYNDRHGADKDLGRAVERMNTSIESLEMEQINR